MDIAGVALLLIVALGVVILIVVLLTRGVFARDLTNALRRVTQQEQALQEKAGELEQRLGRMEHEHQAKLRRAETDAAQLLNEAKQQAMNIRTAAIEEAKHRARQLLLEADAARGQLKREAAKELNGQAVRQTCRVLRELLPAATLEALHTQLVQELLDQLATVDPAAFGRPVEAVTVTTGLPFDEAETRTLTDWVRQTCGRAPLTVTTDAALVAGCLVQLGGTTLDNSLANRIARGL